MNPAADDERKRGWLRNLRASAAWRRGVASLGWIEEPAHPGRPRAETAAAPAGPVEILAAKIVFGHARNRQQLLGPPPTALGHLDDSRAELLMEAAILAARASGPLDDAAERRLRGILSGVGLHSADPAFLARALENPASLDQILHRVRDAHLVSLVYAASLLGADRHDEAGQSWLRYLAIRLKIPAETLTRLNSQFGAVI